jgi:hypothetical protein
MVVKVDPPYKHLNQKRGLCGPTCIQMILLRKDVWVDQERLACDMGTRILKDYKDYFMLPFKTVDKPGFNYGIKMTEFDKEPISKILNKSGLRAEVHMLSDIENASDFILENLRKGFDIMACFKMEPIDGRDFGHFALIAEHDGKDSVTLCDPDYENKCFWQVKVEKLVEGMKDTWDGYERGLVVIRPEQS